MLYYIILNIAFIFFLQVVVILKDYVCGGGVDSGFSSTVKLHFVVEVNSLHMNMCKITFTFRNSYWYLITTCLCPANCCSSL